MVDINLSDGRIWFIEDYDGPEFDKRLNWQDMDRINKTTPYARRQENADLEYPYMGIVPDYGLTGALDEGTVISRDLIDVDYEDGRVHEHTGGIRRGLGGRLRGFFSSDDEEIPERVAPTQFKENFRRKYQRFDDTSLIFVNSGKGAFVRNPTRPRDIYNSSTDVMIIAQKDSVDESYETMLDIREELEDDLQRLANRHL